MNLPAATDPALRVSRAYCHASTRKHARSFYFSSFPLPRQKRTAAYAVYAFCRYADDLVDSAAARGEAVGSALAALDERYEELLASGGVELPFGPAFVESVRRYNIEKRWFLELLEGVRRDLGRVRISDWPALRDYCYHVASVVGLMMARIFELRDPAGEERAIELGIAMQLTNIIRDVGEDGRCDRIYLPATELVEYGVHEEELLAASAPPSPNLKELITMQIARARAFYRSSEAGIPLLADDGSQYTVWLMREVYAGILDEVERNDCDVLTHRAATRFWRKMRLAARAWGRKRSTPKV